MLVKTESKEPKISPSAGLHWIDAQEPVEKLAHTKKPPTPSTPNPATQLDQGARSLVCVCEHWLFPLHVGIEPRAKHLLGKRSITELHPQSQLDFK